MTPNLRMFVGMFLMVAASGMASTQTKPSVNTEMIVDYVPPPTTLNESVGLSDAVVLGVVRGVRTYQPPIAYASVRLVYTVEVSDVVRGHADLTPPIVQVYRFGGDIDEGDHVTRKIERDFPRFAVGHQYLMFLSWNSVLKGFEPKFGPNGIYELMPDGTIETTGKSSLAQSQKGKNAAVLIAEIKR